MILCTFYGNNRVETRVREAKSLEAKFKVALTVRCLPGICMTLSTSTSLNVALQMPHLLPFVLDLRNRFREVDSWSPCPSCLQQGFKLLPGETS